MHLNSSFHPDPAGLTNAGALRALREIPAPVAAVLRAELADIAVYAPAPEHARLRALIGALRPAAGAAG